MQKLKMFIQQHCPPVFSYILHHASELWLEYLAANKPTVCRSNIGMPLQFTLKQLEEAVKSILNDYNDPSTLPDPYPMSAKEVLNALRAGKDYPRLHPYSYRGIPNVLHDLMLAMRNKEVLLDAARGVIDLVSTSLVFLSKAGVQTGFHMDWTEAINLA
jgi:hypothetical protein